MVNQNQKGFTLVEMLVVMAVMAIVSTIALVQYRTGEKQNLLRLTAQGVVNSLRRVQNMSFSVQEHNGKIPLLGGYGAHFDDLSSPNSYVLFADMDGDGQYTNDGTEQIEIINLPDQAQFVSMSVTPMDIIFTAPDASMSIPGGGNQVSLDLKISGASVIVKSITIKKPGVFDY